MINKLLLSAAVLAVVGATAANAAVVYSSVPDLTVANGPSWCSDCYGGGVFEPLDQFTLASSATIGGLNLVTYNSDPYKGLGGFTLEIYDSARSNILFSRAVTPTVVGSYASPTPSLILTGSFASFSLTAGTYWFGAIAPVLALPGFTSGGNGSLIDTTPHTGNEVFTLGGNTGYQLLGGAVPEPASWALLVAGFGMVGFAARRRPTAIAA